MKTYWDHTEKERAEMARGEVEQFLDAELMSKGVLKVKPPTLEPVPEAKQPEVILHYGLEWENQRYYSLRDLSGWVFKTAEQADAFLKLGPLQLQEGANDSKYVCAAKNLRLVPVECSIQQEYLNCKSALETAEAIECSNEAAESQYQKDSMAMTDCLSGVWDDWAECRTVAARYRKILDTLDDYKRTAGTEDIAISFLVKVFTWADIQEAFKWFDLECPAAPKEMEATTT